MCVFDTLPGGGERRQRKHTPHTLQTLGSGQSTLESFAGFSIAVAVSIHFLVLICCLSLLCFPLRIKYVAFVN